MTAPRTCPNCGTPEQRTVEHGREKVNLDPFTGNCIDCLVALTKETGPLPEQAPLFDPRAAAANDRGDA